MSDASLAIGPAIGLATGLVLVAALMHATWNALVKGDGDRTVALAAVLFVGVLVGMGVVVARPLPAREAWPWLVGSALTHGAYYTCLLGAYRTGDLGHVYPIARGSAPILVALGSVLVLDVSMSAVEVAGAALVSGGIASLALLHRGGRDGSVARSTRNNAVVWALATGVTIAAYTVLDGTGARASGDPIAYAGWSFVVQLPGVLVLAAVAGRARVQAFARTSWRRALVGGAMSAAAWIIVLWAMTVIPIAHVAALRETSVIFAVAMGARMLREPFGARRALAAALVSGGLILLHIVG